MDFTADFSGDVEGFAVSPASFASSAYSVEPFDSRLDLAYQARETGNAVVFAPRTAGDSPAQAVMDRLPLWVSFEDQPPVLPAQVITIAPEHTRTFAAAELTRATPELLRANLPGELAIFTALADETITYFADLHITDQHTGGNRLETRVKVVASYDQNGLLMGAVLAAQYGECAGCADQASLFGEMALGWTGIFQRDATNYPPEDCRLVLFPDGAADQAAALPCPPVPEFYATYQREREGVSYAVSGVQLSLLEGEYASAPLSDRSLPVEEAFLDISAATLAITERATSFEGATGEGSTFRFTTRAAAHTLQRTGEQTLTIAGRAVPALVYSGTYQRVGTLDSPLAAGALEMRVTDTHYLDAQSGLLLETESSVEYVACEVCAGELGDYHAAIVGQQERTVTRLAETNQPLGICDR